jgi:hypothetical protein
MTNNTVMLKNMSAGTQEEVTLDQLLDRLK